MISVLTLPFVLAVLMAGPAQAAPPTPEQIAAAALKAAPVWDGHNDVPEQLRDRPKEVIVSIAADGRYAVGKDALQDRSVEGIASALTRHAPAGKDSIIIISADANAPHQSVVSAMEAARRAGLSQITFATQATSAAGQ